MSVSDGRATKITRPKPKRPSTLKTKHNRPPGRLSYGASMFDIGVNLTSSQFAKIVMMWSPVRLRRSKGMLLTGTNIHESQQALKLARRYPIVGRRLASIPMTAVSGHPRLKTPLLRWRTSRKSSLSVSAGWISIAIFPRRRSRSVPFRRSYKLPPNYRCQSLCTAGTRMSDFWHCLILAG